MRQVTVEFVGLLPTLFNTCAKCCTTDLLGQCGIDDMDAQLREYPEEVLQVHRKAGEFYARLLSDFGGAVKPIAVGLTTPRGLWLAFRHRIGWGLSIVIKGKTVLRNVGSYEALNTAVKKELS